MSTREEREEWRRLADAATSGPWDFDLDFDDGHACVLDSEDNHLVTWQPMANCGADAQFVAAARTAVPALLADVERLEAERDEAQAHYRFMVERAADEKLDGYRELGARAAKAENERDYALADAAQLRLRVSDLKLALGDGAGWFDRCMAAERERDALRAWVARAVGALTLALKAYVGGASCRACGAPNDAHYSTCPTNALRAVLADAPKEKP